MYNALGLSNSQLVAVFLKMAGLEAEEIPRFRDCYPSKDGKTIIVYTRTGGNNRDEYEEDLEVLYNKDNFVEDYDDEFDNTYMSLIFTPLPEWKEDLVSIVTNSPEVSITGAEKFKALLDTLEKKSPTQQI